MREIKFRAWDKFDKMLYSTKDLIIIPSAFNPLDFSYDHYGRISFYKNKDKTWHKSITGHSGILMQYTGLKDKNGKEIYGGDIVKCSISKTQRYKGVIEYAKGYFFIQTFWYCFKPMGRWDLQKAPLSGKTNNKINIQEDIEKIIGNIYENPELLKEEK